MNEILAGLIFLALALAGGAMATVGIAGLMGRLPPGSWAGMRLPVITKSDESWVRGHRAAGPVLIFGGIAVFSVAAAFVPFAFAGKLGAFAVAALALVSAGLVAGSVFSGLMAAVNAAGRDDNP
jgi:uncharacterized membrane protein